MKRGNSVNLKFQHSQSADTCSLRSVTSADHSCNVNDRSDSDRRLCISIILPRRPAIHDQAGLTYMHEQACMIVCGGKN